MQERQDYEEEVYQSQLSVCRRVHPKWNKIIRTWTFPVIHALGIKEPVRFNELKRRLIGISATSLAERLEELRQEGIIERKVYPETPPRVEYKLTEKGKELLEIIMAFAAWVQKWDQVQLAVDKQDKKLLAV